jgi:hypothetical protein
MPLYSQIVEENNNLKLGLPFIFSESDVLLRVHQDHETVDWCDL